MTPEQQQLLMLRGTIVSLPQEQQLQINDLAMRIRDIVNGNPEVGTIALALVGAELSVES